MSTKNHNQDQNEQVKVDETENIESTQETAEETITREIEAFKEDVSRKIKTPTGIKVISALISGLIIGFGIWIFTSIITQSGNPTTASWILGIIILQIIDALTDFTPKLQDVLSKILSEKL